MGQRCIAAAGEREGDVKMMPEKLAVEAGVGGGDLAVPVNALQSVEAQRAPRLTPVPSAGVLRLSRVAAPIAPDEKPLLLTAVVTAAAPPAVDAAQDEQAAAPGWTGAALRHAREGRGLSLSALADSTKIARHHLENVEGDRHDLLPSYVYLRGMLLVLAKELRLDGQQVCRSYLENARRATGDLN